DVADTESKQNWRLQQRRVPANIGTNGENVADANDQRRKEFYVATSGEDVGHHPWSVVERRIYGTGWSTEPGLGGVLDGLSGWLDAHRWPAPLGQPQYDWEPSRVASGMKNRTSRLKALGNAVVPQQIFPVFWAIKQVSLL